MREIQQQFYILILYYRGGYVYPSQDTFVPYNPFYSMQGGQHNQPILPYAQQLLSYNQTPNLNTGVAQDDPSLVYPQYPLLNDHNAYNSYNSLPYGDWVIRQAQQNFAPPIMDSYPVNAGFTLNHSYQPGNTQTENSQNSTKENEEPATTRKVGKKKAAKQRKTPRFDPRSLYPKAETRAPWGSKTWGEDGQHLFTYTESGQLLLDRKFNNEQLREYVDNCPKGTVFRVQQYPTKSGGRMDPEDQECRWEHCPLKSKRITTGWLRVCFDEFPMDTTGGKRDPFVCAGSMHLWCFEQIFDPVEFYLGGRLKAETRVFVHEQSNVASLGKHTDNAIVINAYEKWFTEWVRSFNQHGKFLAGREYKDTLSYELNNYHIENQTGARKKARERRCKEKINKGRPEKTINIHMGDLGLYVALNTMATDVRRDGSPEREAREDLPDDGFDSPDSSRKSIAPPPAPRAKKTGSSGRAASYLPIDPALGTSSSHSSQTLRRSLRGIDLKRTSPRRLKKELRRHVLASQPPVDRGHNLSMDSCSSASTSTGYLNTNSTPSTSFGPLNSACSTLPSSNLRPPLKITIPNHNESSLSNAYPLVYPQAMLGSSFSMEDPKQPGHSLGPPPWQYQQQQYSSTAALPYVKAEHQPGFQDCHLNTPLKASRGNDLVESCQIETKTWTPKAAEEAPHVLGDNEGTSSIDSNQFTGLGPEEASLYQFLIIDEDVPEPTQNLAEGSTGAMDNFVAQTQTNATASQSLELVACTESPHVAAVAEPWHSVGSFMDPVNYGGYSNTDMFPLFDDSIATA